MRLPTLEDEAPIQPSKQDLRYPSHIASPGAVGEAFAALGSEIEKQGNAADDAKDQDEYATAHAAFVTRKVELEAHIDQDPNWQTAPDTYKDGLKDAQAASAAMITNPKYRAKFNETAGLETAQGLGPVLSKVGEKQKAQDLGDLDTTLDAMSTTGLNSPQNSTASIQAAGDKISAAVAKGTISPDEGVKKRQAWVENYGKSWMALQKPEDQVRILTTPQGGSTDGVTPPDFDTKNAPGMEKAGNLDPWHRPVLHNADGSYSTTSSMSIGTDDGEVLIPTVVDGKRLSKDDAISHYNKTGENFGTFKTPEDADKYATALHNAQASMYDAHGNPKGAAAPKMNIKTAILGQESGGNQNAPDSPTGAMGVGQIEPATWKRFAQPGEDPHDPKDSAAVSGRIIDHISGLPNVQGDPARIAVGYYSGEGNIAPLGSATPYKRDVGPRAGVKGPKTSEYVAQVTGRMGGAGGTPAAGSRETAPVASTGTPADFISLPEREVMLRQAEAAVRADQAGNNAAYADSVRDTIDFLHSGGDASKATVTPDQVRAKLPGEEGAQLADSLQHGIDYSAASKRIATMPEIQLQPFLSGKMPQGPTGFRASAEEAGALVKAAADRQKQIYGDGKTPGDPVSYVLQNFPDVAKSAAAATGDPKQYAAYVQKVRGAQTALGIAPENQRILSSDGAQTIVHQIQTGDPKTALETISSLQRQSGSAWPQVYGDLARAGLPASFQALTVVQPQDAQTMAAALGRDADARGKGAPMAETMRGVKYDAGDGKAPKSVTDLVEQQMARETGLLSLRSSYGAGGRAGAQGFDGIYDAVRTTALYLFQTRGLSPSDAASAATKMVAGQFDFVQQPGQTTLRLPKGTADNFSAASSALLDDLKAKDLKPLPTEQDEQGHDIAGRPESERADQALTHAKSAYWIAVPGADGRGAARAMDPQTRMPVLRANGKPLDISFGQMATMATAAAKGRQAPAGTVSSGMIAARQSPM